MKRHAMSTCHLMSACACLLESRIDELHALCVVIARLLLANFLRTCDDEQLLPHESVVFVFYPAALLNCIALCVVVIVGLTYACGMRYGAC